MYDLFDILFIIFLFIVGFGLFADWVIGYFIKRSVNKDWTEFKGMTESELRNEYHSLLKTGGSSDRFRRLCYYISFKRYSGE